MRRTQNLTQALERMAPWVEGLTITAAGERGRWLLEATTKDHWPDPAPLNKKTKNAAAFVAGLLMQQANADVVRDEVNWTGRLPLSGLPAHEEAALIWLRKKEGL